MSSLQGSEGYIAPDLGFDSLRDAAAAIRCTLTGDAEGLHAILTGTLQPRNLAGMTASIAAVLARRTGLDDEAINALLSEISTNASDFLLDQPAPGVPGGGGEPP